MLPLALIWNSSRNELYVKNQPFRPAQRICSYGVPTWSWGSITGDIVWPWSSGGQASNQFQTMASLTAMKIQLLDDTKPYGPIKKGRISLRAPTFSFFIESIRFAQEDYTVYMSRYQRVVIEETTLKLSHPLYFIYDGRGIVASTKREDGRGLDFKFLPDVRADYAQLDFWNSITCCIVAQAPRIDSFYGIVLIPVPTEQETKIYIRVGRFILDYYFRSTGPELDFEFKEFTIV